MKIFLSWSGSLSKHIAEVLHKYLPFIINELQPFISGHIESGSRWNIKLMEELEQSSFGILCLTSENLESAWLLFEAGALTKHLEGRACGLLIGSLKPNDVQGPLSQFQHRKFARDGFGSLLEDINSKLENPMEKGRLNLVIDKWWADIYSEYENAVKSATSENKQLQRPPEDILDEILTKIRVIEKNLAPSKSTKTYHLKIKGEKTNIIKFINDIRKIDIGGQLGVFQQYQDNLAAVNIASEGLVDIGKLFEIAGHHQVDLEWAEM
jgi:hypothetical protein